ncbi:MAG: hypothetical protein EOO55_03430, partial [Hymenobacter sp.]
MKHFDKLFLPMLGLGLLTTLQARAQLSVGNGATAPRAGIMLDVNGPIAAAETTVAATGTTSPTATVPGNVGQVQLTAGSAAAGSTIAVTYSNTPQVGQQLAIYNNSGLAATFSSQAIPAGQAVEFIYSNSGWRASGDGGNSLAASNGLTKTANLVQLGGALTQATTLNTASNTLSITGTNATSTTFGAGGGLLLDATQASTGSTGVQRLEFTSYGDPNAAIGHTTMNGEINDLYLYSGNDSQVGYGPDRIRLVGENVLFQSFNNVANSTLANAETNTSTVTNMFIGANGNVGIGTVAPVATLSIKSTTANAPMLNILTATGPTVASATATNYAYYDIADTEYHQFGGSVVPDANSRWSLGTSTAQWSTIYGVNAFVSNTLAVTNATTLGSTLAVTDKATFSNGVSVASTGQPTMTITSTSAATHGLDANTAGTFYYEASGTENHMFGGNVVPDNDNGRTLGASTNRWLTIYSANNVIQTSDSRLKTHITNAPYGLHEVLQMRPVTYNWKTNPDSNRMVGFIAQEMEQLVPEAVETPKTAAEHYGMKYSELIPVLTRAIQEQQAQIVQLQAANAKLQAQAAGAG